MFPTEELTDDRRKTTRTLDLQEIPLYVINNKALKKIEDGSSIDPLILEGAVKYDRDNKETVKKYKFLDSIPKMLEGLEKTVLNELRKEMIDIERDLEDKSIYEDKETESGRRIKEGSKFAPEQSEVMGLAKDKKVSNKVAKEIVESYNKLKSDDDKGMPFGQIIGILSEIDFSSVKEIRTLPYNVFFKGKDDSIESTLSAGNYVATEKQKIITAKAKYLQDLEEEIYSDTNDKVQAMKITEGKEIKDIYEDSKGFLQEMLLRYLNDLEYVFDIEFIIIKTTKTTNKTKENPEGKTTTTYNFKRLNAKRKEVIFKGGGLNPDKRQTTKILESKTNISMVNTFINSIRSRVDTLERGI